MVFLIQLFVIATSATIITVTRSHCEAPSSAATLSTPSITPPNILDLSAYSLSVFLPWVDQWGSDRTPSVQISIENDPMFAIPVDTGSTGILLSASSISGYTPAMAESMGYQPAYEFLSSSSRLYVGHLVPLYLTFYGQPGADSTAPTASSYVPVIAVEKLIICPWYDPLNATADWPPKPAGATEEMQEESADGIAYMGVGFGRAEDGQPWAVLAANAFLNIYSCSSSSSYKRSLDDMRIGWIISTEGVTLGLTNQNTANMKWESLLPRPCNQENLATGKGQPPECLYPKPQLVAAQLAISTPTAISLVLF